MFLSVRRSFLPLLIMTTSFPCHIENLFLITADFLSYPIVQILVNLLLFGINLYFLFFRIIIMKQSVKFGLQL